MGDDFLARIDLSLLYPPFAVKVEQLVASLQGVGAEFFAIYGLRSFDVQNALFAKGRTLPGPRVTNAKAGYSAHNYGIAVDLVRDADVNVKGLQPIWKADQYRVLADESVKLGLEAGYNWTTISDADHVQLPLKKYGITWVKLLAEYHAGGTAAVFAYLDQFAW